VNGVAGTVLDQLDLGVQFSLYHRSTGGSEFVSEYTDPAGNTVKQVIQTQSVRTNLVPVMATLRVRFPVSPGVEPYLGGGLGYEWLTVEGTDGTGLDFSNDYSGFGAQAYAGVNFSVGPQTSFYGEALYNASTVNAEFFNPFVGTIVREEVDFGGAGLHGGLRFRF
jgi:opacity protein-like surface antigen